MTFDEWKDKWANDDLSASELDMQAKHFGASIIHGITHNDTARIWDEGFFNTKEKDPQMAADLLQAEAMGMLPPPTEIGQALRDIASDNDLLHSVVSTSFENMMPKSIHPDQMMRVATILGPKEEIKLINNVATRDTTMQSYLREYINQNVSKSHMEELSEQCDENAKKYCDSVLANYHESTKDAEIENAVAANISKALQKAKDTRKQDAPAVTTIQNNDIDKEDQTTEKDTEQHNDMGD